VTLILDTDALLKLVRAGAKEAMASAFDVALPPAVYREAVDQGAGHADAELVAADVRSGRMSVRAEPGDAMEDALLPDGGEREVLRLYLSLRTAEPGALASDDERFLRRLRSLGVTALTPGTVLVLMVRRGAMARDEALACLDRLRSSIGTAQYEMCRGALESGVI
jgi:hypothetical protein